MSKRSPFFGRRFLAATLLGAIILTMAIAGLAAAAPADNVAAAQAVVDMADFTYAPNAVTIRAGGRVVWLNTGGVMHNVSAVDGSWDSGAVGPGAMYDHVFTQPGVYQFYSRFYAGSTSTEGMTGQVTVLAQVTP